MYIYIYKWANLSKRLKLLLQKFTQKKKIIKIIFIKEVKAFIPLLHIYNKY